MTVMVSLQVKSLSIMLPSQERNRLHSDIIQRKDELVNAGLLSLAKV